MVKVEALVNLEQYPIHDLDSAEAQELIARSRAQLQATGKCSLPNFLKPEAAGMLVAELGPALSDAHVQNQQHNVYFKEDDANLPADHPARRQLTTHEKVVAYDRIPEPAGIRAIYNWKPLRNFIARVVGRNTLYLHEDTMAPLNIMILENGGQLGWHYDRADFVTTLLLQAPEAGGKFEYISHLRTDENENYAGLGQMLDGTHADVISLSGKPGTLTIFQGYYSPHRVTPVKGSIPRINSILSYTIEPGVIFSGEARLRFYGRAQ